MWNLGSKFCYPFLRYYKVYGLCDSMMLDAGSENVNLFIKKEKMAFLFFVYSLNQLCESLSSGSGLELQFPMDRVANYWFAFYDFIFNVGLFDTFYIPYDWLLGRFVYFYVCIIKLTTFFFWSWWAFSCMVLKLLIGG